MDNLILRENPRLVYFVVIQQVLILQENPGV